MVNAMYRKKSLMHTQKRQFWQCIAPFKNNFKKAFKDIEYSVCGDKGINFLDHFFDKGGILLLSLQRHCIPQRLSCKKKECDRPRNFFFFCAEEVFRDSKYRIKWKALRASSEMAKQKTVRLLSTLLLPRSFSLSSSPHYFAKSPSFYVAGLYTHTRTQIPLHRVGRLRDLLEFARTAQTQINVCNWCSASLGFLTV